ncbi:MAG: VOC family protein [Pseudomonadales bacterium]|nr:VOC family protein [Pseudomonadales bacterium]
MDIKALGYVGFGAPDPQQWLKYGTEIIGAMPARAVPGESWGIPMDPTSGPASGGSGVAEDGSVYLKFDDRQWRVGIHPSEDNAGIMYIGLEVDGVVELEAAVAELKAAGYEAELGTEEQARNRAVTGIAYTRDPAGNSIELFYGACEDFKFRSPLDMSFKMGDMGVGHINLIVSELQPNKDFYIRVLGFKLSDYIGFGPDMSANFYHCNRRHHSIGLMRVGPFNGVHHLMLECNAIDDVLKCYERVLDAGINVTSTLGRHVNDNMLSFYMSSPFGFEVEIGFDGYEVDDNWRPREFCEGDLWGHRGLTAEAITESAEKIRQ